MSFAPCLAPFVMGFRDVNVYGLRDESPGHVHLQGLVNEHTHEDDNHWPMFLDDLDALGLNARTDLVSALRTMWSTECDRTRQLTYGLMALDVVSFGESAIADEGAGDAGEGKEVLGFAL
ncbi:hypothetical protein ABTX35_37985, partial [Streptomyces sp. NPDC096080]